MESDRWKGSLGKFLRKIQDSLKIGRSSSSKSYRVSHSDFEVNNGISNEKKGESSNYDVRDVHGGKDGLPLGKEENGKNDFDKAVIIDEYDPVESLIIDYREKLKETDEYKRALEEEQSARQVALQVQAEEAQQLRHLLKRKKSEDSRLSEMELRKKQRVEEIRETQKKDEEDMNLKEQYRTEVREELKELETTCLDMASLLYGLGLQVGNGPDPSPDEVQAAYKQALFCFHPDRATRSDMRQQIEAEEKFKLISHMKEKFSL